MNNQTWSVSKNAYLFKRILQVHDSHVNRQASDAANKTSASVYHIRETVRYTTDVQERQVGEQETVEQELHPIRDT